MKHRPQTVLVISLGFALAVGIQMRALALDPPGEVEIASSLGAELPAYWLIDSLEVSASVNEGDEVSPRYRQRFVASAVPREELYLPATSNGTIGPFVVLVSTRTTTQAHKLYGTATSVLALGKWSTELVMENSVEGLGTPRSLFSGSVVVAGSAQADQAAADLLKAQELRKTVEEGIARASVDAESLEQLAKEEMEALEAANRSRLEALRKRYEQERATIAADAERERKALEATGRQRLEALKAKLDEEDAAIETMVAAADRERNRLVEENQRRLAELKAKYEQERAAVTASAETLKALSEAEAETAAHRQLVAALTTLTEERKRATELAEQAVAAEMQEKTARYDALLAALRSENISQRNATLDLALASGDEHLKTTAIAEAMKSGDDGLQAKALAALMANSPRIGISIRTRKGEPNGNQLFEITSLNEKNMTFSGRYFTTSGKDPTKPNGTGSVQRDRLSLTGRWLARPPSFGNFNCNVNAQVDDKGILSGSISCGKEFVGRVEINL